MEKIKPIIWRLYLSTILVTLIGSVIAIYPAYKQYGSGQFAAVGVHLYVKSYRSIRKDTTKQFEEMLPEHQVKFEAEMREKLGDFECLENLLSNGGMLKECFLPNQPLPVKLSNLGLNRETRVNLPMDLTWTWFLIIFALTVVVFRYWITWLTSGVFPRRFP